MADARQAPPAPPAAPPAGTTYADSGAGGGNAVQVTRNVPPKRVQVVPDHEIVYGGKRYTSEDEPFLIGEGPVADQLAFDGHVVVTSHEEVEAWNGAEGEAIRKAALGELDAEHKADGTKRAHAHGFESYEHADVDMAMPVDVTQHRQQVAQRHLMEGRAGDDEDFNPGGSE